MTARFDSGSDSGNQRGAITLNEIRQQPELWPTTVDRVASSNAHRVVQDRAAVICGAGSSAYAASAIAASRVDAVTIPTTDLLTFSKDEVSHAPDLPDDLRPFEIVFSQLLAYPLSLASQLDHDNPSPNGVITRVVQRFQLH